MLLRQAYCRLFVSLTVAPCPSSLWLTDQAYCSLFVSLIVASCPTYLWLTDQAYCMLLRQAYCRPLIHGLLLLAGLCGLPGLAKPTSLNSCSSKTACWVAKVLVANLISVQQSKPSQGY